MEAPEATLDPFRTVSLGFSVNSGNLQPGTLGEEHYCPRLGFAQVVGGHVYSCNYWNEKQRGAQPRLSSQGGMHGSRRTTSRKKRTRHGRPPRGKRTR